MLYSPLVECMLLLFLVWQETINVSLSISSPPFTPVFSLIPAPKTCFSVRIQEAKVPYVTFVNDLNDDFFSVVTGTADLKYNYIYLYILKPKGFFLLYHHNAICISFSLSLFLVKKHSNV